MKYHSLKGIYYQDRERYRQVIHERTEDPVAVHTGLMSSRTSTGGVSGAILPAHQPT